VPERSAQGRVRVQDRYISPGLADLPGQQRITLTNKQYCGISADYVRDRFGYEAGDNLTLYWISESIAGYATCARNPPEFYLNFQVTDRSLFNQQ
jgi:hypothetical protein